MINQLSGISMPMQESQLNEKQFSVFKCHNGYIVVTDHGRQAFVYLNRSDMLNAVAVLLEGHFQI